MRIIAGRFGGRRLRAPRGAQTRPTADRVRESLFSILGPPPEGAAVLDLFAGAGTLGLEALSRGAASVLFVDRDRQAVRCLRENIADLETGKMSNIHQADIPRGLRKLPPTGRYHWIFLDPPYRTGLADSTLEALGALDWLSPEGVIVVEHDRRDSLATSYGPLDQADQRRYGDTVLTFFRATASMR